MIPSKLPQIMEQNGTLETYAAGDIFHSQDFAETLFMLKSGYAKRYQVAQGKTRVIELIYGPSHIFPLSQLYKKLFGIEQNQENLVYVYQAMTDIEIIRLSDAAIMDELDKDPLLYADLFYEAGLRLKSNIERLASNALQDEYKKVAHQLVCLADEFGRPAKNKGEHAVKILVPLQPVDMAEQLNMSVEIADAVLGSLNKSGLISTKNQHITIPDINLLKDTYL